MTLLKGNKRRVLLHTILGFRYYCLSQQRKLPPLCYESLYVEQIKQGQKLYQSRYIIIVAITFSSSLSNFYTLYCVHVLLLHAKSSKVRYTLWHFFNTPSQVAFYGSNSSLLRFLCVLYLVSFEKYCVFYTQVSKENYISIWLKKEVKLCTFVVKTTFFCP